MSAALALAGPDDLDRVLALVAACHGETGIALDDAARRAGLAPLLDGSPHGCIYLIGPKRAPVGYVVIAFGWSSASGGLVGTLDDIFLRPPVRGRGIATEALSSLARTLGAAGLRALHHATDADTPMARLCARCGFAPQAPLTMMTKRL